MRWLSVLLAVTAIAGTARGSPSRPRLGIRVSVDVEARLAAGRLVAEIENVTAAPLDHLELWRFPARLERRSPALDEHDFFWVYPYHFDAGTMAITEVRVDGEPVEPRVVDGGRAGPGTLVEVPLAAPLAPGQRVRLEAAFSTRVPHRYNAFGCYRHECTLAGGFYPMPVELGPGGYDRGAPPARADLEIAVESAAPAILVDGVPAKSGEIVRVEDAAWAVLDVGRPFREAAAEHRGVRIRYYHRGGRPPAFLDGKRAHHALEDVRDAIELLHELDLDAPAGTEVRLVEAPLRLELASPQAHVVLVSDQIYRLFPHRRFRKFHSFQLLGAVFDCLLEARLAARESPRDLALSPNVASAWLVDLFTLRTYRRREFASDILRWVSFIPAIDRLLYAPQIPFATAYFNTLDDPDPTRDDLHRFSSDWPRGKVIHEKLRDLLGDRGMTEVMRELWSGVPLREAAEKQYGRPLDWFFRQWLGPRPEVDYRFEIFRTEKTRAGFRYHFRLFKRGPNPPVEPVELQVTEWSGTRHVVRWDGRGSENVFALETRHRLRSVTLDPRGRLTETLDGDGDNNDLRLDDRRPASVKLIYNNFGALFNFQTLQLDLSLDFSLQRVYDLKNLTRLLLYHSESVLIGGLVGYSRGFGRKILPSRLSSAFTTSLRVARLDERFASSFAGAPTRGSRISVTTGLTYDNRRYIFEPWRYLAAAVAVSYSATVLDDLQVFQQLTLSASLVRGVQVTPTHGFAIELTAAATFGDLRLPSQMLFAGGPLGIVRGYEADELPGRSFAGARVEYRHVFVHDLDFNLFYFAYLRGLAGGLFAEAALVSPCDAHIGELHDAAHGLAPNLFGDVGYSLRLLGDLLGVSQTVFNVEVAVPLVRRDRSCLATAGAESAAPHRFPIGLFVYFGPVW